MKTENLILACEAFEEVSYKFLAAHADAVNGNNPFATMALFSVVQEVTKLNDQVQRIKNAANWCSNDDEA